MKFQNILMTGCKDMSKTLQNTPEKVFPFCDSRRFFLFKIRTVTFVPSWYPNYMQNFRKTKGPFKNYLSSLGGRGSSKIVTKSDNGGRGLSQTVMSPLMRNFFDSFQNYWFSVINFGYRNAFSLNLFLSNNKTFYIVTLMKSEFRWGWG